MTKQQELKRSIRAYMQAHYTDERLAQLLAHAQDGKLAFDSCCCFIGVATADHPLRRHGDWNEPHYFKAQTLAFRRDDLRTTNPEIAYSQLASREEDRRRILIPMIRAEQRRRDRLRPEGGICQWVYPGGESAVEEHECNDCGILIPLWRPICTLCERWYEDRGLPLPIGVLPETAPATEPHTQPEAKTK